MIDELTLEEFEEFVQRHEAEIISILYLLASKRWAQAHVEVAICQSEIAVLTAKKEALETILESHRRRIEDPALRSRLEKEAPAPG